MPTSWFLHHRPEFHRFVCGQRSNLRQAVPVELTDLQFFVDHGFSFTARPSRANRQLKCQTAACPARDSLVFAIGPVLDHT